MNLFSQNKLANLLPKDGEVIYYGPIMGGKQSVIYFNSLLKNINWKNDEVVLFGKHIVTKRKVAWYGNESYTYNYSNTIRQAEVWTPELLELKELVEEKTGEKFNSCLLNLYHDGNEGMSWHSDDEKEMVKHGSIASLSFGADRKFSFKHKTTKETISVLLEKGSLLVMKGATQDNWLHAVNKTTKVKIPRINLTFRQLNEKK
jgi:alkylated DNA repair dioxygenase AlkB